MCTSSKLLNPAQMLPGSDNKFVNPTSMVTNSSNRWVNPAGSLLTPDSKAPATAAPATLLTTPQDGLITTRRNGTTLLGS